MKQLVTIFILFQIIGSAVAQKDSSSVLSYSQYIDLVEKHHPIAISAGLREQYGEANLKKSKGGFDPVISTDIGQKYFDDKQYYRLINSQLKIPTWFGPEFKAGYDLNNGDYLNPQENGPSDGLFYAGISVPIGQGLLIDKRRAELRKAKLYVTATQYEKQLLMNELIFKSGSVYWKWFGAYQKEQVYKEAYNIALERLESIKLTVLAGDKPGIDTVEAVIQLQNRQVNYEQAKLEFKNLGAMLSIYLWQNGTVPMEINENLIPTSGASNAVLIEQEILADSVVSNHPKINFQNNKLDQLDIEQKLAKELLKPKFDINYNPLLKNFTNNNSPVYSLNNYKWGLSFKMPLFLRKERAFLEISKLNIQDSKLELENTKNNVNYKYRMALNEMNTLNKQLKIQEKSVRDTEILLNGEIKLFQGGESSLFMVNSRESMFIKSQLNLIDYHVRKEISVLKTIYTTGKLGN